MYYFQEFSDQCQFILENEMSSDLDFIFLFKMKIEKSEEFKMLQQFTFVPIKISF